MLSISNLSLKYGKSIQALRGVDIEVESGAIVALLGSNGAGKTSLLRAVSGNIGTYHASLSGTIRFEETSILGLTSPDTVRKGIVQVPEGRRIFQRMTVQENLTVGGSLISRKARAKAEDEVFDIFPILKTRGHQPAGLMSGGEQQMLAIGRALMSSPRLLMLDEPSLGLAPKMIAAIAKVIREINERGTTVLLIEQNANMALEVASHAYVLELGRVAVAGATTDEFLMAEVRSLYLGGTAEASEDRQ